MAENKVKFHALERLDLVDVNALQDNVYEYIAEALGNFIGIAGGLLRVPTKNTISIDNVNEHIDFPDFVYLESVADDDYTDAYESRIVAFDASLSNNGDCDFSAFQDSVQTYYNNNNALPDYTQANNSYFPRIYARQRVIETTNDSRRFWSPSNNTETTLTVSTRKKVAVDFLLSSTVPAFPYTQIGRIIQWGLNGNNVILPNAISSIELFYATDSLYFGSGTSQLDNEAEYAQLKNQYGGGLKMALRTIRKQISDIRGNGQADSAYTFVGSPFASRPYLSLDALYQRGIDLEARLDDDKIGSVIFTLVSDTANNTHTIEREFYSSSRNLVLDHNINAYFDYESLHNAFPSTNSVSDWTSSILWAFANSVIAINFGNTYTGYGIQMTASVVHALANRNTTDANVMQRPLHAQPFSDNISSGATFDDVFKVSQNTIKNLADADVTFYGIKVSLTGLVDFWGDIVLTDGDVIRIPVKIDFRLIKAS